MRNEKMIKKQKEEALLRMRLLGLNDAIEMFNKYNIITESISVDNGERVLSSAISLKHKRLVEEVEEKYGILVYHVIYLRDHTLNNGVNLGESLNMLYVSQYESDWPLDRQAAKDKNIYIYHLNMEDDNFSEYGLIGIDVIENTLIKRVW